MEPTQTLQKPTDVLIETVRRVFSTVKEANNRHVFGTHEAMEPTQTLQKPTNVLIETVRRVFSTVKEANNRHVFSTQECGRLLHRYQLLGGLANLPHHVLNDTCTTTMTNH